MKSHPLSLLYWLLIIVLIVVFSIWAPRGMSGYAVAWHEATSLFIVLVILAFVVERAQEVVLTVMRAAGSEARSLALSRLEQQFQAVRDKDPKKAERLAADIMEAQQEHLAYRSRTRVMALYLGLLLGVLISSAGFRLIHGLVPATPLPEWQEWFYNGIDILLSGTVIAGGSDGVHKLAELYRNTVSRASGKLPDMIKAPLS